MKVNGSHNGNLSSPHPGTILRGELAEAGMSQKELAVSIGKTTPVLMVFLMVRETLTPRLPYCLKRHFPTD